MKANIRHLLMWGAVFPFGIMARNPQVPQEILLHQGWEFSQVGHPEWRAATVPGTVHQDLLDHNLLVDPFYGQNEDKVQWVEQEDWMYRTTFHLSPEQMKRQFALLCFEGLDTYADIYLNGTPVKQTDNMFVGYQLEVKNLLKQGENRLDVVFHSPIRQTLPQWQMDGFSYPADNDHSPTRVSVYSRKAPYSYGWDWGIRLATCGIWRPVSLRLYDEARIDDWQVYQNRVDSSLARVKHTLDIRREGCDDCRGEVELKWTFQDHKTITINKTILLRPGLNSIEINHDIPHPQLWMPNGWGKPNLYDVNASVRIKGVEVACLKKRIGIRDIHVVMEDDNHGKSFYFMVNGQPLFAKGANFIPSDALLPRVTAERYRQLMKDVKEANHNMIRVWGGGIYEDEQFYNAADEMGILVWQDFLFACTTYPGDSIFLERVAQEAVYNIKRLRNHASLAMWCGNNEIYEGMRYWGWNKKYTDPAIWKCMQEGYDRLFRQLLPNMVEKYDKGRFYMHSSPYEANWGRPESWNTADSHNWGIWYGQKPFESLDNEIPRFMSEYGFQSFPEMKTIATFAHPDDYAPESDVMNAHQKSTIGNALIKKTMALYYDVPEDFRELVYRSLVLQGFGIRHGIEAHRRNRPYCMGSLYWQLNDSWPVISWSGIDYYGNWKALHYQSERAFSPLLVHAYAEEGQLAFYALSDLLYPHQNARLSVKLMDFNGKVLKQEMHKITIPANASTLLHRAPYGEWGKQPCTTFLQLTLLDHKGHILSQEPYYFCYPKDQKLPVPEIKHSAKQTDGTCILTLKTSQLARDVFIEVPILGAKFSDNFFDLMPGETKRVKITSDTIKKDIPITFNIKQMGPFIKQ